MNSSRIATPEIKPWTGNEARLVLAAQLQIARVCQQLLSSIGHAGINRIVVTCGHIAAEGIFDMWAYRSYLLKRFALSLLGSGDRVERTPYGVTLSSAGLPRWP
jgi:hypothetical protein